MTARGPPPSFSTASYSHGGGGSAGSSDSLRTRGRNPSAGSSGRSSREHSEERRGRGGGGGGFELKAGSDSGSRGGSREFVAGSYHNQYQAGTGPAARRDLEGVNRSQQKQQQQLGMDGTSSSPSNARWAGPHNQGALRGGGGSGSRKEQQWRFNNGGKEIYGRVQGVYADDEQDDGPARARGTSATRAYSLTIRGGEGGVSGDSAAAGEQENGYYGRPRSSISQENGYVGHQRQQEYSYGGNYRQVIIGDGDGSGGLEDSGDDFRRTSLRGPRPSSAFDERGTGGSFWALPVASSRPRSSNSKEAVFGDARELHTFGSPSPRGGLSRITVRPAPTPPGSWGPPTRNDSKLHWEKGDESRNSRDGVPAGGGLRGLRDGDLRRSFADESVHGRGGEWTTAGSSGGGRGYNNDKRAHNGRGTFHVSSGYVGGRQVQKKWDQEQIAGDDAFNPSPSSSKGSSNDVNWRNGFEGGRELRKEQPVISPSPSPSRSSSRGGVVSRKNSLDKKKSFRQDPSQLPVFSPSSENNNSDQLLRESSSGRFSLSRASSIRRESSSGRVSRDSPISDSMPKDSGLEREDGWTTSAAAKQLWSKNWESASAGMHRTRSTDWYEICLREEQEEELQALARRAAAAEEEAKAAAAAAAAGLQNQKQSSIKSRDFSSSRPSSSSSSRSSWDQRLQQESGGGDFNSSSSARRGGGGGSKRETTNYNKSNKASWLLGERVVRGDPVDKAQPNSKVFAVARGTTNKADSREEVGLFTPWNALQQYTPTPTSNVKSGGPIQNAQKSKALFPQYTKGTSGSGSGSGSRPGSSGEARDTSSVHYQHENVRVTIAGGRQATGGRGRRTVSVAPAAPLENEAAVEWKREEENPKLGLSRDHWKGGTSSGPEHLQESAVAAAGSAKSSHDALQRLKPARVEKGSVLDSSSSFLEVGEPEPEDFVVTQKGNNVSIRPSTLYRALHDATAEDDEPLPHIVGTCPDMCPAKERIQRERLRDLAVFERVSGDMKKTSKNLAVKKFCRTVVASELDRSDIRPLPVLWKTLQYLLGLLDDPEFAFDIIHNFLFDRTRAIRQELGMQRILDKQSVTMLEEIVRFHILSEHELRDLNRKRSKQMDTHLNLQQLSKSLHSLLNLYICLGGTGTGAKFENEAEFYSYYVLLNLGNHGQFQAEPLSLWLPNVPSDVLGTAPMRFARNALRFYRSSSFVSFFRLVREATYMQSCLLELNFDSLRATAVAMLNVAEYKLHPYPLSDMAEHLILQEAELDQLCMYYGLLTGMDNSSQKLCLLAKQSQFVTPEKGETPKFGCTLIDSKRAPSYFLEVKGASGVV